MLKIPSSYRSEIEQKLNNTKAAREDEAKYTFDDLNPLVEEFIRIKKMALDNKQKTVQTLVGITQQKIQNQNAAQHVNQNGQQIVQVTPDNTSQNQGVPLNTSIHQLVAPATPQQGYNQNGQQMVQPILNNINQNQGVPLNTSTNQMVAQSTPQQGYSQYIPQQNYNQNFPQQNYNQNFRGRGFSRGRGFNRGRGYNYNPWNMNRNNCQICGRQHYMHKSNQFKHGKEMR